MGREDMTVGSGKHHFKPWSFLVGLLLFFVLATNLPDFDLPYAPRMAAAVIALMAVWWMTLALPIPVTSLVPIIAFPLLGIMSTSQVVLNYANRNIFLFLGGFIIALALEKWNVHRRIALWMMARLGGSPGGLVLGILLIAAILSMWISNTATAMMMLPIGMAVVSQVGKDDQTLIRRFAPALMLAIAYGASVGGIATPIGTPPNIEFLGQFEQRFPDAPAITFFDWLKTFLPLTVILLPIIWLVLTRLMFRCGKSSISARHVLREQYRRLGRLRSPEVRVLIVFFLTALLWVFRNNITIGSFTVPGWSSLFPHPKMLHDATVAIGMAILLFILPSGDAKRRGQLMDWETALRVPWGILLLFGGGFAVAGAFFQTGLAQILGEALRPLLEGAGIWVMILMVCLFVTFLTELTSNTATAATLIPIMTATALAVGINPLMLMIPTTISASCAFMLPVATPPNAIIFGSGKVSMGQMVRTGLVLNVLIAVIVSIYLRFALLSSWGMSVNLPDWAK